MAQGYRQDKWFELNRVINTHRIAVLAVQETHLTDELAASFESAFDSRLKLFHSPLQETRNAAGVAIIINKGLLDASEIKCTTLIPGRAILAEIPWHAGSQIKVLNVYAPNDVGENEILWERLNEITSDNPSLKPDIMLGDFNLVEDSLDRLPCHPDNPNAVAALGVLKGNLDLVDGWRRTFPDRRDYSHHHVPNASQGRIDRIYVTSALLSPACDWKIDSTTIETDHWLVSVKVSSPEAPLIGKGRWQIPTYLLDNEDIMKRINDLGKRTQDDIERVKSRRSDRESPQTIFSEFKRNVTALCRQQAKKIHPTILNKVKILKTRLLAVGDDPHVSDDERMLESLVIRTEILELERVLFESCKVYAKAKHHVHAETICRDWIRSNRAKKPRDTIFSLFNPLDPLPPPEHDSNRMAAVARDYHEALQHADRDPALDPDPEGLEYVLSNITPPMSQSQKAELAKRLKWGDVHKALSDSGNDKAAGLDGIPMDLWKTMSTLWDAFSEQDVNPYCDIVLMMVRVFNDIEEFGIARETKFNEGWMCPIYKKGERNNVANYRPITVLNTDYKTMTKALATKLAEVAPTLVHRDQAGFIKGRSIFDQVKLTKLAIDYGRIMGKNGAIVLLDQEKAYDKILHPYLWKVLERFDLPRHYIRTIKHLYQGASTSVVINGVISEAFSVVRGVRQGDALSCLLFDLGIEPLAATIRASPLKGIEIRNADENVKCKFFADDCTTYLDETDDLESLERHALTPWCKVSGAVFNIAKTEVIPIGTEEYRTRLIETRKTHEGATPIPANIKIAVEGQPVRTLGAWVGNGVDQATPWTATIEKIAAALKRWEANHPTTEGRRLITQMIIGGMTQYLAKVQSMPESASKTLERMIRNFAWSGEGAPTVAMTHMSTDMTRGGRKVLDIGARNEAIQLTWAQAYLKLGEDRPTWAHIADEIFANDAPGELKSLEGNPNARINQFLQTWHSRKNRKGGSDPTHDDAQAIPRDLREMVKVARKFGVRLEAADPAKSVREELPAIRCSQTKAASKPETLCDKFGKCIRDTHGIKTLEDAALLASDIPRQHKKNRKCRCTRCSQIRRDTEGGCRHPNKCIERAGKILDSIKAKWNPTSTHPPEYHTFPTPRETGPHTVPGTNQTIHTLNPFRTEESLKGCFRVFTDGNPTPEALPTRAPRTEEFAAHPITVYTDGSCSNNGETTARAGSGVWFGDDDPRNTSMRVPGPDQSNQTGELIAILHALRSTPPDRALTIKTDSMYAIQGLTVNLEKWEDKGWLSSKHAGIFKCLTAWMRYRSNTTKITWVKGHSGVKGNEEADKLAAVGAASPSTSDELDLTAPADLVPSGAKLSALAQRDLYRTVLRSKRPPPRRTSELNVGRIQACATEVYGTAPTEESVWKSTRHCDLTKKTREFLWKCLHNAFKIGKFWSKIEGYEYRGICSHCGDEESMEHILTECSAPGRVEVWALANALWRKRSVTDLPHEFGALLGCGLTCFKKANGKPDKGLNRLFRILVSESMYMIWKLRCERAIAWSGDPTKYHTPHEIHNKWLQAVNTRLRMDSVHTNKKIFKKKVIQAKLVLQTWDGCLMDNLHETRNWCGKTGVLVGIATRRPPGRNR